MIDKLIDAAIGREGGYSDHPSDRGGATKWGITERVARANGYKGSMKELPRDEAKRIYKEQYWIKPGFHLIDAMSTRVADELFDTGINMGPAVAVTMLQEALNALNAKQTLYGDIVVDGDLGPATVSAFKNYMKSRNATAADRVVVMLHALDCLQGARYIRLGQQRNANEDFMFGWLRTRIGQA